MDQERWKVERRSDGAVLVRVLPRRSSPNPDSEAVFAFRQGDPQFHYWDQRLREQEAHAG
jgi:hypothetical protein